MKTMFLLSLFLFSMASYAAQKAITDTGETVILYSNGTWKKESQTSTAEQIIKNTQIFKKPIYSNFLLKSTKNDSGFWINSNKWLFKKSKEASATEYTFQLKGKDLYAMAITEKVQIPLDTLSNIALENAQKVAPDTQITYRDYRKVNSNKVLYMEMKGTIQGIKFTYRGYYYSDKSGTTQLVTYTASNLIDTYKPEINNFLNGFVSI